jgi:hypothetical protein
MLNWRRHAPLDLQEDCEAYADMVNMPQIGSTENYMWPTHQFNMAVSQYASAGGSVHIHVRHMNLLLVCSKRNCWRN